MTSNVPEVSEFDETVDVLIVGSGGGGMTAALTANAAGLDTLVVEKSAHFGGSTALSGGGIWVPGAPSQRRPATFPTPTGCSNIYEPLPAASSATRGCVTTWTPRRR